MAVQHDLWIISDEVYEEVVFEGTPFASAFDVADLAERTVALSSLSKSHAAAGYRRMDGGPEGFIKAATPWQKPKFLHPALYPRCGGGGVGGGPISVAARMRANYARRA